MGGNIRAESRPGKGSTFIFTLKLPIADQKPRRYLSNHVPELNDLSLLIVDDNRTNLRIMEKLTQSWGMQPVLAGSAEKALEILDRSHAFDMIILDWHMPDINGLELAELIHGRYPDCRAPLIMLSSAEGGTGDREVRGFTAYLRKPVKQSDLFDTLISTVTQQSVRRPAPPGPTMDEDFAGLHPMRILVAEDNTVNQKLAILLLEKLGYRPDLAGNGLEVLDLLGIERGLVTKSTFSFDYDLILMDCQMPEMDGYEATGLIRQWEAVTGNRCVIVALTANAMEGDRKRCLEAGMDDYLSKPLIPDKLVDTLRRVSKRINGGSGLRDAESRS
jgi:CheY-like chemotaxis protein